MSEVMSEIKTIVQKSGKRVDQGSEYCKRYVATHENCKGCESKEGCDAMIKIGLIMMTPMLYKPNSFQEFLEQSKYIQEKIKDVLDGKEVDLP